MKGVMVVRYTRLATGLLVVASAAGASGWWKRATGPTPSGPPAAEFPDTLDLGPRRHGQTVSHSFRVANRGGAPLDLSRFRTSCSCAGVEVEHDGRWKAINTARLAAGEFVELRVRIAVGTTPGTPQRVLIRFDTNDPDRAQAAVEAVIPVVTADTLADPAAVSFGSVPQGGSASRSVTVYDCGVAGRRVGKAYCTGPGRYDVRLVPLDGEPVRPDHPFAGRPVGRVEVVAHADRPGPLAGTLVVEMQDAADPACRVALSGEVVPAVDVTPSVVYLPRVVSGRPSHAATLRLSTRGGEDFTVTLQDVPAGLTARVVGREDEAVVVEVACSAGAVGPVRSSPLRLGISRPAGAAVVEVPVYHPGGTATP